MLRKVSITCPRCDTCCQLHLGNEAPVVVIRCPRCATSLMSVGDEAIVLNEQEMEAIRRGEGNALILRHLVDSGRQAEMKAHRCRPALPVPVIGTDAAKCRSAQEESGERHPNDCDDVVQLHRELEHCRDSAQFIRSMG